MVIQHWAAVMPTFRTHSFGQEPRDTIRVIILGPAPGALWGAWQLRCDVTTNTAGNSHRWLQGRRRFLHKEEISAETFERLLRFLVDVWASDLKRRRNDANKHGNSKQLKSRKTSICQEDFNFKLVIFSGSRNRRTVKISFLAYKGFLDIRFDVYEAFKCYQDLKLRT